jgi:Electron transfer DM13
MWIQFGKKYNILKHNHISMQKKILITLVIVAAIAIPIGIYTLSPLFVSATVNELLPATVTVPTEKPLSGILTGAHDGLANDNAEGNVKVVSLTDGSKILRLENFKSTNGPNVHVYLSTDKRATDYVDLGKLKANNGNQNYDIPAGTDIRKHNIVLIWCKDFSVLFGSAVLI